MSGQVGSCLTAICLRHSLGLASQRTSKLASVHRKKQLTQKEENRRDVTADLPLSIYK